MFFLLVVEFCFFHDLFAVTITTINTHTSILSYMYRNGVRGKTNPLYLTEGAHIRCTRVLAISEKHIRMAKKKKKQTEKTGFRCRRRRRRFTSNALSFHLTVFLHFYRCENCWFLLLLPLFSLSLLVFIALFKFT